MRIVVAVVFLVLTTSSAVAQENERGSLAGENQKLRSQIKQMEKQLAKAEAAGFHFNENGYSSVLEIVKELPRELGVKNSVVWDNVESEKVAKFVSDMGVGSSIKVKHRVKVTTKVNPSYRNNDKLPPYEIVFEFAPVVLPYRGKVFEQTIQQQKFYGDDEAKKYAESLNGKWVVVSGIISECVFRPRNGFNKKKPGYTAKLKLTQGTYSPALKK